jgi:hypothetical protein
VEGCLGAPAANRAYSWRLLVRVLVGLRCLFPRLANRPAAHNLEKSRMTPTDLFKTALRQIGVLGRGQNVSAEQLNETQMLCNMMLGQWTRKRWLVFHLLEIYTTGTGSPTYTLGPGDLQIDSASLSQSGLSADMSTRINRVEKAFVRINPGAVTQTDIPLNIVRSAEDWSMQPARLIQSGFPRMVWLDSDYPVAVLHVWPAPSSLYEIHILMFTPLVRMNNLSQDINLPDEYQDAIFWNLCKRLLNSYRKPKDPEIDQQAAVALNTVRNANFQLPVLRMPRELTNGWSYNIYSDNYS